MLCYKRVVIALICLVLASCSTTRIVEVPVETVKTLYVDKVLHDSIYIDTSTEVITINDTVYKTKIQYKYKEKYIRDTICIVDSIPKIVKVKEVEYTNVLTKTLSTFYWIGILATVVAVIVLIAKIKKLKL